MARRRGGWFGERFRHRLSAKGVHTAGGKSKQPQRQFESRRPWEKKESADEEVEDVIDEE